MQRKFISRRSFLKCAGMGAVTAAAAGLLAGCGGSDSSSSSTASSAAAAEPADPNKPYAGVTLYYAATDTEATGPEMQDIVAMVKEKTGINIEFNIIPKADTGEVDKRLVSLQAGDALDIVYGTVAQLKVFYDAGVLEPLDEMASAAGYDIKSVFGDSAPVYDDGQTYSLPALGRTGLYTLIYVPVIMVLSFILAYLLNKGVFWAKGIRLMFFLPYVSNMVAVAVVFQLMLGPRGPFYLLQKFFGVEDPITAYGFAKMKFPGRDAIFLVLLAGLMIPSDIMIMPRYIIFKNLGILNTMWSLILPAAVDVYFVFLLRQAFVAVPEALSEAARIDGCSHFTIYRRIILPLCMPQVSTMLLFSFVWSWNDYMGPYLYISDINKQMISVGIKLFASGLAQDYGAQMAGATLVLIPVIVAFFLCQKYFVEGITAGAVKG